MTEGSSFGHAIVESFCPPGPQPPQSLLAPATSSDACGEELKHKFSSRLPQLPERPWIRASVLELRPPPGAGASGEEAGSRSDDEGAEAAAFEAAALGPISALLHVPAVPVVASIDTDAGLGVHLLGDADGQTVGRGPCWRTEAGRVLLAVQAFKAAAAHAPERPPPAVAVFFAIAIQGHVDSTDACGLASNIVDEVTQHVSDAFFSALREVARGKGVDVDALEVASFCVAVTRSRGDGSTGGFTSLRAPLADAVFWSFRHGAGPCVVPEVCDLLLPARILGHWAQSCLSSAGGLPFPQGPDRLRASFEVAVDACVVDLAKLHDALPQDLPEWLAEERQASSALSHPGLAGADSETLSARQQVLDVRGLLWALDPPVEAWAAAWSPEEFWRSVRQFLQESPARLAAAPCPEWWKAAAPQWDPAVLRAVAPFHPRLSCRRRERPAAGGASRPQLPAPAAHRAVARARFGFGGGEAVSTEAAAAKADAMLTPQGPPPTSQVLETAPPVAESSVAAVPPPPLLLPRPMPVMPAKPRGSMSDLLRRDAAWSDSLLRGVALLAATVPGAAADF